MSAGLLRRLAAQRLAQEKPGQTLQATALVHEAYLRLVRQLAAASVGLVAVEGVDPLSFAAFRTGCDGVAV